MLLSSPSSLSALLLKFSEKASSLVLASNFRGKTETLWDEVEPSEQYTGTKREVVVFDAVPKEVIGLKESMVRV